MSPSEKPSLTNKHSLNHLQTPDETGPEPSGTAKKSKGYSSSKRKSGSPIPSGHTTRPLKRNSPLDPKDQPTLTQIDFVSKTQDSDSDEGIDDDLDYIGQSHGHPNEVIRTGDTPDYSSRPRQRPRRARDTRFDQSLKSTMPSRKSMSGRRDKSVDGDRRRSRKSETPKAGASASGKSKKGKDKEPKDRNKTLTQMDFVQRWVNLDSDDDDTTLDYMYNTPKDQRTPRGLPGGKKEGHHGAGSSGSKRRKLDKEEYSQDVKLENVPLDRKASSDPVTPQKPRKLEIPSSQSPESPGFAIISSSQFRGAIRSPLKWLSANVPRMVQEESPGTREKKASPNSRPASQSGSVVSTQSGSNVMPSSQMVPQAALDENSALDDVSTPRPTGHGDGPNVHNNPRTNSSKQDRTVVYETDGENDSDDLEDDWPGRTPSPTKQVDNHDPALEDDRDSQNNDDSQDLPPINPSEHDNESAIPHSEPPFSSDASLCYRRIYQPTQFPQEPVPILNTQKMAELFPPYNTQLQPMDASETQSYPSSEPHLGHDQSGHTQADASETQSYPSTKHNSLHQVGQTQEDASETQSYPSTKSHSLHDHRDQPQTQDLDNMSTEIVPESSPVTRQDDEPTLNPNQFLPPPRNKSVVQVESSQPVDRLNRHANDQGSYPRGVLSKSDLLTSSVMESIPMPQFMMGSQDSVGEPYSMPDG